MAYLSCSSSLTAPALLRCLQIGERLHAAGGIGRRRAQQFGQFVGGAGSEPAIGAARQPRDLAKGLLADRVVALLEHEGRDVAQAELAGAGAEIVERFLHGVADEDQGCDLAGVVLAARMGQHLADLGMAAAAIDLRHQRAEPRRLGDPGRGAAFGEAAIIDELDIEAADGGGFAEHVGLQPAGGIPGRLPAHGGVEREDQPAALAGLGRWAERVDPAQEGIDLGAGGRRRSRRCDRSGRSACDRTADLALGWLCRPTGHKVALTGMARNGRNRRPLKLP